MDGGLPIEICQAACPDPAYTTPPPIDLGWVVSGCAAKSPTTTLCSRTTTRPTRTATGLCPMAFNHGRSLGISIA